MRSTPDWQDDGLRRYLFAAGTAHYENEGFGDLPGVERGLAKLVSLFKGLGYECIHDPPLRDLTTDELERAIDAFFSDPKRLSTDLVVFYYAGHGVVGNKHYLACRDSNPAKLELTAIATGRLPNLFWPTDAGGAVPRNAPTRLLIMLDTCYSGLGLTEIAPDAARVLSEITSSGCPQDQKSGLWMLSSAWTKEEAYPERFVDALDRAMHDRKHGGPQQSHIWNFEGLWSALDEHLSAGSTHRVSGNVLLLGDKFRFFPNPTYAPEMPPGLDLESQRSRDWTHWSPKARGVEVESQAGSYFTGRTTILRDLLSWLRGGQDDRRARIVTGQPGSGKSAVLAWLVIASFPPLEPASADSEAAALKGLVDVAVHARGKDLYQVVRQIAAAMQIQEHDPDVLLNTLSRTQLRRVVIVDALNEALEPGQIGAWLARLATASANMRIVIGGQKSVLRIFPPSGRVVLDLDEHYFERADVVQYIRRRLLNEPKSPFKDQEELAQNVAAEAAGRAGTSFLIAQVVSRILVNQAPGADPDWWKSSLAGDLDAVFEQDLLRFGENRHKIKELLEPLAWSEGGGLPWENLWPRLASAISGRNYVDSDIRWLEETAGGYIVEDPEHGYSVYRVYHDEFARFLRNMPHKDQTQRRITTVLRESVPSLPDGTRDWSKSLPYVQAQLAAHAAQAGMLDELLSDTSFLPFADPERLVREARFAKSPTARSTAQCYRNVSHLLKASAADDRRRYLRLSALLNGRPDLFQQLGVGTGGPGWEPLYAWFKKPVSHRVVSTFPSRITAACLVAGPATSCRCWVADGARLVEFELENGRDVGSVIVPDEDIVAVDYAVVDSKAMAVAAGKTGLLWVMDTETGAVMSSLRTPRSEEGFGSPIGAITVVSGDSPAVICGFSDGWLRRYSLPNLALGVERKAHESFITSVKRIGVDGRELIVTCSGAWRSGVRAEQSNVRLWDSQLNPQGQIRDPEGFDAYQCLPVQLDQKTALLARFKVPDQLCLVDPSTGHALAVPVEVSGDLFACLDINGTNIALSGDRWGVTLTRVIPNQRHPHDPMPFELAVSPTARLRAGTWLGVANIDGQLAAISYFDQLRVWSVLDLIDAADRSINLRVGLIDREGEPLFALAGDPDGSCFCGISRLGNFRVWNSDGVNLDLHQYVTDLNDTSRALKAVSMITVDAKPIIVELTPNQIRTNSIDGREAFPAVPLDGRCEHVACTIADGDPFAFVAVEQPNPGRESITVVRAWNLRSGAELDTSAENDRVFDARDEWAFAIQGAEHKGIEQLTLGASPHNALLAAVSKAGYYRLAIWHWPSKRLLWSRAVGCEATALILNARGHLVCGDEHGNLRAWAAQTGNLLTHQDTGSYIGALASFTVAGRTITVSGHADGRVTAWSEEYQPIYSIHLAENILSLAALQDQRVAVATERGFILLKLLISEERMEHLRQS